MKGAVISPCGMYRYILTRGRSPMTGPATKGLAVFCLTNPSTGDEDLDDQTIKSLQRISDTLGYNGFHLVNMYAYRSTDPEALKGLEDPYGPENPKYLTAAAKMTGEVIVAWGKNRTSESERITLSILKRAGAQLFCLGLNRDGTPRHPLYLKAATVSLQKFNG